MCCLCLCVCVHVIVFTGCVGHVVLCLQDVSAMTEEQQLALALQMSMAGTVEEEEEETAMDTNDAAVNSY